MSSIERLQFKTSVEKDSFKEKLVIDKEKYNVLAGVIDIQCPDRNLPIELVAEQLKGMRIGVNGEPSTGKSTFLIQLLACSDENAKKLGIAYQPKLGQYDFELSIEKGLRKANDGKGNLEGTGFNERLVTRFKDTTAFELPGVGRKDNRDRGRSAFEKIAYDIGKGIDNKTILLSFPCNRLLQIKGGLLRSFIVGIPKNDITTIFDVLEKHKMNIVGIPKTREVAQIIQNIFKKMGQEEHIKQIRDEESDLYSEWENKQPTDIFSIKSSEIYMPEEDSALALTQVFKDFGIEITHDIKGIIALRTNSAREDTMRQAIKMADEYKNKFHIGKDKGIVALNTFTLQPLTLDFSSLLK